MRVRIIASSVLAVTCPQLVLAQELPTWRIDEVCAKESATGQCALFEGRARNAVTASWDVMPEAVKKSCLAAVKNPLDQSWRLLSQCIERETLEAVDRRAVATAATPAEPVPAPQPAGPASGSPALAPGLTAEPPNAP
jgi:hypothetical protein